MGKSGKDHNRSETRGKLIRLLRSGGRTVADLASDLSVGKNAVRAHLAHLEKAGIVKLDAPRPGVRKPHKVFRLTKKGEQSLECGHEAVLEKLLAILERHFSQRQRTKLFAEVGDAIGKDHMAAKPADPDERLHYAMSLLRELGGSPELAENEDGCTIRGATCPLASLVSQHPSACEIARQLIATITEVDVRQACSYEPRPQCCFIVPSWAA